MKIEIKCRFGGKALFEHDCENNTLRLTAELAVEAGANLVGANLVGANLAGANLARANLARAKLAGADLAGADLAGANLYGANLDGANLAGANLAGANLDGAYLAGAYLAGANLGGAYLGGAYLAGAYLAGEEKLISKRPVFQIGPIGSRCAYLVSYITDKGLRIRAGCFFGTSAKFKAFLKETHGDNEHAEEYKAALTLINKHYKLWGADAR
jgi:uncharacterized protein YjbI with pentapeptide repeats